MTIRHHILLSALCVQLVSPALPAQIDLTWEVRYAAGEYDAILRDISAMADESVTPELLRLKGDCLQKASRHEEALTCYDRCGIRGYQRPDLFLNRGICRISLGYYEDARPDLIRYLSMKPGDGDGYYWLATLEYFLAEYDASIRYLDESIAADSTYAPSYFLRAAAYSEKNRLLFALEDFMRAYTLDPALRRAKLYAGVIMLDLERYRGAIELFTELHLEAVEETSDALYYRGEAHYRLHDAEGACADWTESAALGNEDASENYRRVCVGKSGKPRFKRHSFGAF
jgi:tetratricopeptide (TPR) repeat protein